MASETLYQAAATLLEACRKRSLRIATAESCTGGLIAAALTDIPGSSDVFERGFVTYSNTAKTEMLGVSAALLDAYGAVSEAVARAMAEGALKHSGADISIATTGIAGPGGGSAEKPVGLAYIALATKEATQCERHIFKGDRHEVRIATLERALRLSLIPFSQNQ